MPAPVARLLADAETALSRAGCPVPVGDATLLLAHAMCIPCETLLANPTLIAPDDVATTYQAFVDRRAANREPTAYITGRCVFRKLQLAVDSNVLIPCIETELLVEAGIELPGGAHVVDVGTGCGAVALALKSERPDLDITATDISSSALDVARGNGARLGLDVAWREANLLDGISDQFDAVLANLPYYASADRVSLGPELVGQTPAVAVFSGSDELALIKRLLGEVAGRPEIAMLALEIGPGQGAAVAELLPGAGFRAVERKVDLTGAERAVVGRRL